jgi:hypothetical protein
LFIAGMAEVLAKEPQLGYGKQASALKRWRAGLTHGARPTNCN